MDNVLKRELDVNMKVVMI